MIPRDAEASRPGLAPADVYLLALHEPYPEPTRSDVLNAVVVHADTLRHPLLPQPHGAMIFRCLTEFPGRTPGEIVPLSTLTHELDGGRLWPQVADWQRVLTALVPLTRPHARACDAIPLGLPPITAALLANGPHSQTVLFQPGGPPLQLGPAERAAKLQELTERVRALVDGEPLWPGQDLVDPPTSPARLPYQPRQPSTP